MNNQLITAYLTESEYAQWNALVTSSAQGSIYSTPEYLDALCEAAGGSFKILAVKREEEILGGVGLYQRGSGSRVYVSPRLLLYYNGLVFRNYDTKYPSQRTSRTLEIMGKMEEALNTSYCDISLRNRSSFADARLFTSRGWKARLSYTYVVPVGDLKSLWERVEQNLRRLVNRCTREGVQMTDDDDIEAFIQMHQQTVERKGTSLYLPPEAF